MIWGSFIPVFVRTKEPMIEILLYSAAYLVLFGCTELLYHRFSVQAEVTRKIVHVSTGLIALSFPVFLQHFWQVCLLCLSFLLLLAVSEKFNWFKSITAVERKSYGSWLFALIVLLCFWVYKQYSNPSFYFLPLLILSICDPLAAYVGKKTQWRPLQIWGSTKTVGGSLAFLVSSFIITLVFVHYGYFTGSIVSALLVSCAATVAELVSTKGWDNLTIPLTVMAMIYLL